MAESAKSKWWPICWKCLRGLRLCTLLFIFIVLSSVIYFNEVGLPNFLKHRLLDTLHTRGVDLQFSRLRWRWYRGLVAEDVRFGAADLDEKGPQLSARDVAINLNRSALIRFKVKVDAITVNQATLAWPLDEPGQIPLLLSVTNIQTQLRFLTNDQWELDQFNAGFAGAKLHVVGSLTNASVVRDWKIFHGHHEPQPGLPLRLRALANTINQIKFAEPPEFNVILRGDARQTQSLEGHIVVEAPNAETPWGNLTHGSLLVHLLAATNSDGLSKIEFRLKADEVETPWASTRNFKMDLEAQGDDNLTNLVNARLEITASQFMTRWAQGSNALITAQWTHSLTNFVPFAGKGELVLSDAQTPWGSASELRVATHLITQTNKDLVPADESWGWWKHLQPYSLAWDSHLENIHAENFESKEVVFGGNWFAPVLTITNLHTEMYQGKVNANASLNVVTRLASFAGDSDFDVQKALPLFPPGGREWFERQQFGWEKPPVLSGSGSIILPEWTNRHPNWNEEVRPTLSLAAQIHTGDATYHTLPVTSVNTHLTYTNMVWNLPDLVATRPEGNLNLAMRADDHNKEFYFNVHSAVDLKVARKLLATNVQDKIDWAVFTQPPVIDAEIWGRWREYDKLGARGHLSITNFSFRGEPAASLNTDFAYTNKFLLVTDPKVLRTNQIATATSVGLDFAAKKGYLTNGFSTMEPGAILHSLGPKISKHLDPYHFTKPPTVHAYGVIPLSDDTTVAALHFTVEGGTFEWMWFHFPYAKGNVDWLGEHLTVSDIHADFYKGKATAKAEFDFRPKFGADFTFDTIITSADLASLMADLTTHSNHLEGTLNGHLNIAHANTHDENSWFGDGQVDLSDGLIWEFPIFGILSPVLDAVSPGLGKSRASSASGKFIITNSVIRSDNLEIRSPAVRLFYNGTVDFHTRVDATVEAQVGHDAPIIGPLVSTVLTPFGKLFETKVTGTLTEPKQAPLHFVTRLFTPFIHPFHTIKELFSPDAPPSTGTGTNIPPVFPDVPEPPANETPAAPK